jgi:dihydrodipicolinate synthase/N-acetylneuraminate lyase
MKGDLEKARSYHEKVMKLSETVYSGKGYGSGNVINGIKYVLKAMNICNDYSARPLLKVSGEKAEMIDGFLNSVGNDNGE